MTGFARRIATNMSALLRPAPPVREEDSGLTEAGGGAEEKKDDAKCAISDEHGFVYVVVPKVACTSLKTAILPLFGEDLEPGSRGQAHKTLAHAGAMVQRKHFIEEVDGRYRDHFKFAFVRNPWDRLVSCYLSKIGPNNVTIKQEPYEGTGLWPGMSFEEFADAVCRIPDEKANVHFRSQSCFVCSSGQGGPLLADYVGHFESLEEDFAHVAQEIGSPLELPHSNRSGRRDGKHYRDFYDEELAERVGHRYREDVSIFGYSF